MPGYVWVCILYAPVASTKASDIWCMDMVNSLIPRSQLLCSTWVGEYAPYQRYTLTGLARRGPKCFGIAETPLWGTTWPNITLRPAS